MRQRTMPAGIPILLYHRVGSATDRFCVTRSQFLEQLRLVAESGRTPLTVSELAEGLRGQRPMPPAPVCLTFDDGYADTRRTIEAVTDAGLKATLYVVTGSIDAPGSITAADLAELSAIGPAVELGAHTVTHPYLDELQRDRAASEIEGSREAMARLTGAAPRSFAYPHGAYSAEVRRLVVDAGFDSAVAVKNALSHVNDDPWAIARFTVRIDTSLAQIRAILEGRAVQLAWPGERSRTRAYRLVRKVRHAAVRDLGNPRASSSPASSESVEHSRAAAAEAESIDIRSVRAPVAVAQIDLSRPEQAARVGVSRDGAAYGAVALLIRDGAAPKAWTMLQTPPSGVVTLQDVPPAVTGALMPLPEPPPATDPVDLPQISVVITTCADAAASMECVRNVLCSRVPAREVIVVDNRPERSSVRAAMRDLKTAIPVRYVAEAKPGLAIARSAGAAAATGEIIAFTDDDVHVDRDWVGTLAAAFASDPTLGCVTGLILPLELESEGQLEFERFAALNKGLASRVFSGSSPPQDMPLFPYTAGSFGSGANCAFRRDVLSSLGGFDPLLGAGTRTRGGEDLDIFIRLMRSGGKLLYEPGAIIWHRHPSDRGGVDSRTFDYGVGLGAVIGKLLLNRDTRAQVTRLAPRGLAYWLSPDSRRMLARTGHLRSPATAARETLGVLAGSLLYLQSRLRRQ